MTDLPARLSELFEHAVRATDPEVALHALSALRRELEAFERVQAWKALDAGSSYGSGARAPRGSRPGAHRRYPELAAARRPAVAASPPRPRRRRRGWRRRACAAPPRRAPLSSSRARRPPRSAP